MIMPRRLSAAALAVAAFTAATAAAAAAPAGCEGVPSNTWLNVSAEGLRNGNGLLTIALYPDDSRRFLASKGTIKNYRVPASSPVTKACIFVPRPGVYAIAVYHDADGNRKLNRTTIGLPSEGFGFSNNPSTLAGLPAFRSVRLAVTKSGLTTHIRMKYP